MATPTSTPLPDALLALREALKTPSQIQLLAPPSPTPLPSLLSSTHILLPPYPTPLPRSTPTRFLRPSTTTSSPKDSDFYPLDAVYYAYLARNDPPGIYMRNARSEVPSGAVSTVDRKGLVDWLEGRIESLDRLLPLSPPPALPSSSSSQPEEESTTPKTAPPLLPTTPFFSTTAPTTTTTATAPPTTTPGSSQKRRYVPDGEDLEFLKRARGMEVELRDRGSVLRGGNLKTGNFDDLRHTLQRKLKALHAASKPPARGTTTLPPAPVPKPAKAKNQFPIIMISSSPTALITMHNVKQFLEDADFIPSSTARSNALAAGNSKPEDVIPVYRARGVILPSGEEVTRQLKYFVVDGVDALGKFGFGGDPWDRVVCVMTTGQTWQFKPYKWPDARQLFHHVKGVHVQWAHEPPNAKIADWNVTSLKIDQNRRHVDKSVVAQFWRELDAWTAAHKPWLATPSS